MWSSDRGLKPLNHEPKLTFSYFKLVISGILLQYQKVDYHGVTLEEVKQSLKRPAAEDHA
jgi:hypothetical protein